MDEENRSLNSHKRAWSGVHSREKRKKKEKGVWWGGVVGGGYLCVQKFLAEEDLRVE